MSIVINWAVAQINDDDKSTFVTRIDLNIAEHLSTFAAQCKQAQMCLQGKNKALVSWSKQILHNKDDCESWLVKSTPFSET